MNKLKTLLFKLEEDEEYLSEAPSTYAKLDDKEISRDSLSSNSKKRKEDPEEYAIKSVLKAYYDISLALKHNSNFLRENMELDRIYMWMRRLDNKEKSLMNSRIRTQGSQQSHKDAPPNIKPGQKNVATPLAVGHTPPLNFLKSGKPDNPSDNK